MGRGVCGKGEGGVYDTIEYLFLLLDPENEKTSIHHDASIQLAHLLRGFVSCLG